MAAATDVQVSHFLDEYGVGAFHIKLIIWSTVIAFIDGYHIGNNSADAETGKEAQP